MQAPTRNPITQTSHLASKAVDYDNDPDPTVYAPEDGTIVSYGQSGVPGTTDDAGNALRLQGATGLHQFAHLETAYVKPGDKVKRGQPLAKMGHTGYTIPRGPQGAHLHYWVKTPQGYKYPPTLYNESFIKLGDDEMYEGRSAESWAIEAKDAQPYKQAIIKSTPWKRGMGMKVGNVQYIIDKLQEAVDNQASGNDAKKLNKIKQILEEQ